jgi:hypothetical protein
MMTATYAGRFDGFAGESFEVSPAVDQPPSDKLVRTRLIQSNGKKLQADSRTGAMIPTYSTPLHPTVEPPEISSRTEQPLPL